MPKKSIDADAGEQNSTTSDLPEKVVLAKPYGYFDADDVHHFWGAGMEVTDHEQIADLMQRMAPLEGVDHGNTE